MNNPAVPDRFKAILAGLTLALVIDSAAAPLPWVREEILPEIRSSWLRAALDANDYAHLVYGDDALYHDWQDASGWHTEVVDPNAEPGESRLALDAAGRPHVAYYDERAQCLKYARLTETGWVSETAAQVSFIYYGSMAMVLDSAGVPHITWFRSEGVFYLTKTPSGWQTNTVAQGEYMFFVDAMRCEANGDIQVALNGYRPALCIARGGLGGWTTSTILEWSDADTAPMRFDAAGRVHTAYSGSPHGTWGWWYYCDGQVEPITTSSGFFPSEILIGQAGEVHIVAQTYLGLNVWSKGAGGWTQQMLAGGDSRHWFLAASDPTGQPYVLFGAAQTKSVWKDDSGWHVQEEALPVPPPDGPGAGLDTRYLTLMIGRDGHPRLAGEDGTFQCRDSEGWHERLVCKAATYSGPSRLAIDPQGRPHILYETYDGTAHKPVVRYGLRDASGWSASTVGDSYGADTHVASRLVLDSNGVPHIIFASDPFSYKFRGLLHYGIKQEAGWAIQQVNEDPVREAALTLDTAGFAHILAYQVHLGPPIESDSLAYLWEDEAGWHKEILLEYPARVFYVKPDIQVDSQGRPHVAFFTAGQSVNYGYRSSQGWELVKVSTANASYGDLSLALDPGGQPHMAFQVGAGLRYASQGPSGWAISLIDSRQCDTVSLRIGQDSVPQVAYDLDAAGSAFCHARLIGNTWERSELLQANASWISLALDAQSRPHAVYSQDMVQLVYTHPAALEITSISLAGENKLRLQWQGASEGVGLDQAPSPLGPWSPLAEDLSGLECTFDAPPSPGFFRLRHGGN